MNSDFTVMVTISATGEKGKLLVIGKSHRPRGFPKGDLGSNFPVNYEANKKGWMTSGNFFCKIFKLDYLDNASSETRKDEIW